MSTKVKVTAAILNQITEIRDGGLVNMFSVNEVKNLCEQFGFNDALIWIQDNEHSYAEGVFSGFEADE